jgi:hypothetical protein
MTNTVCTAATPEALTANVSFWQVYATGARGRCWLTVARCPMFICAGESRGSGFIRP